MAGTADAANFAAGGDNAAAAAVGQAWQSKLPTGSTIAEFLGGGGITVLATFLSRFV